MTDDGNIVDLGKAHRERRSPRSRPSCPTASSSSASPTSRPPSANRSGNSSARCWKRSRSCSRSACSASAGAPGIVVGLSVPIVLGVVALVMLAMGWNLERVSLGSLIIALGLLVDDGIIAVEMMVVKMEEGWDRRQGRRLLLLGDRDAAADRRADHRRRLHADRVLASRPPASTRAASSGSSAPRCCSRGSSRG